MFEHSSGELLTSNPDMPNQMYSELDTSKVPFGEVVEAFLLAGGIPSALWWFPFIFLFVGIVGLLSFDATQRSGGQGSLLVMCIVIEMLLIGFGVLGAVGISSIIPLWPAFLFPIAAIALVISTKHTSVG